MIAKLYAIYDSKIESYMQPFFSGSDRDAVDAFSKACNDPKTTLYKHAGDFTLFAIATFDDQTGTVIPEKANRNLGLATHHKKLNNLETSEIHAVQS